MLCELKVCQMCKQLSLTLHGLENGGWRPHIVYFVFLMAPGHLWVISMCVENSYVFDTKLKG